MSAWKKLSPLSLCLMRWVIISISLFPTAKSFANPELPLGNLSACPFIHDDIYDLSPLLETLKAQLDTELSNRNSCSQALQGIFSNLSPLHDFYKTISPDTKQQITRSVYANALAELSKQKLALEFKGDVSSPEYQEVINKISIITSSDVSNEIDLQSLNVSMENNTEAYYRNQLAIYVTNVLSSYNSTLRSNPQCIGYLGGWGNALSAVMGGFSIATGLGANPTAQVIGAAIGTSVQLVTLLQDRKVRSAYNDLVRLKNYKTLACTYYSIKKTTCEYQRAFKISQDNVKIKKFLKNQFESNKVSEYDRYFVNRGRIKILGDILGLIAQMGSPLTLDQALLNSYLAAKAVDFKNLGAPPEATAFAEVIKSWLLRARSLGVSFAEINYQDGGVVIELKEQLEAAKKDIASKLATIASAEKLMRENPSFLDLRRRLSNDFPNIRKNIIELRVYLESMMKSSIVPDIDKGTIGAALNLTKRLQEFLEVAVKGTGTDNETKEYEADVISKGGLIFEELAKGAVAQLTAQSVLALRGKGIDRLGWAFGVIKNSYLARDLSEQLPTNERFAEYQRSRDVLVDVISNYQAFSGAGTVFRNDEFIGIVSSFEKGFKKEMLQSIDNALLLEGGIPELKGHTAAHLCAMYYPSLEKMRRSGLFGDNKAKAILSQCKEKFKKLPTNRLVSDKDFTIDYSDECTYLSYSREIEIQNILALLLNF